MLQDDDKELSFLGVKELKMLKALAEHSGRTPKEEVKNLIRRRALGHLKDLGDDRGPFRLSQGELPILRAEEVELHG